MVRTISEGFSIESPARYLSLRAPTKAAGANESITPM
jgi:hypothetical protein